MSADRMTFLKDVRAAGSGSPVPYNIGAGSPTDFVEGEFAAWNSARELRRFVRDGSAGKFVGITAFSQVKLASLGNQAALASRNQPFDVWTTGVHRLTGSVGETYSHGDAVYMAGTDTQAVTKTAGTGGVQVGVVWLPDGTQVTGAVDVPVAIDEYTITQA